MRSVLGHAALLLAVSSLGACAVYHPVHERVPAYAGAPSPAVQAEYGVEFGVISGIDRLESSRQLSGNGALAGGVAGAVIGRQFGGSSDGRALGTFLGAVAGILIGNEAERQNRGLRDGVRVSVRLDSGAQRNFDFAHPGELRIGDRVRVNGKQLMLAS